MKLGESRPAVLSPDCRTAEDWFAAGDACLHGKVGRSDYEQAMFCFRRASELNHPTAGERIAYLAAIGKGVVAKGEDEVSASPTISDGGVPEVSPRPLRNELEANANRCPSCGAMVFRAHPHREGGYVCARVDGGCGERLYMPISEVGLRRGLAIQPYKVRQDPVTYSYLGRCVHEVKYDGELSDDARMALMDEVVIRIRECCVVDNLLAGNSVDGMLVVPAPSSRYRRLQPVYYMTQRIAEGHMEYGELLRKHTGIESKDRVRGSELGVGEITCAHGLAGRSILLVDDTYGEGATLRACIRALRGSGAGDIFFLSLCKNTYGGMKGKA